MTLLLRLCYPLPVQQLPEDSQIKKSAVLNDWKAKIAMILMITLMHPPFLSAAGNSSLEQGIALYQRENNDEAAALLEKARKEDPASTRAAYYLGITYKRLQRYPEAKKNLLDAVTKNPKIKEALPELIEVLYELGDADEAAKWISTAEEQGIRPAQTAFLKGLVLMKKGQSSNAIDSFNKAKELDRAMIQSADYQIGLAHVRERSFGEARKAFQEVISLDPNSDISQYADEYSKALASKADSERPLHFRAGFFTEWDTNVILKPGDTASVNDIGDEGDFREVVTAGADYTKKFSDQFSLKGAYDLYYANQTDLNDFDVSSHTWSLTPSWTTKKAVFSVPFIYNFTLVDSNERFLSSVTSNPLVNFKITDRQIGQLGIKFQIQDYYSRIADGAEDRDGFRVAPGAGWFYLFPENKGSVGLRYEFDINNTDGNNWDYVGNRLTPSIQFQVPHIEKLRATLASDLFFQSFRHSHTVFGQKRGDQGYTLSALLSYELTKNFDLQFRYTYVKHVSNLSLYDYDRNVFSTGVSAQF